MSSKGAEHRKRRRKPVRAKKDFSLEKSTGSEGSAAAVSLKNNSSSCSSPLSDPDCEKQQQLINHSNRLGLKLRSWRTITTACESATDMSTSSTLLTGSSNHSAVTVGRKNRAVAPMNGGDDDDDHSHEGSSCCSFVIEEEEPQHAKLDEDDGDTENIEATDEASLGDSHAAASSSSSSSPSRIRRRAVRSSPSKRPSKLDESDVTSNTCRTSHTNETCFTSQTHEPDDHSDSNQLEDEEEKKVDFSEESQALTVRGSNTRPNNNMQLDDSSSDDSIHFQGDDDSSSDGGDLEIVQVSSMNLGSSERNLMLREENKKKRFNLTPSPEFQQSLRNAFTSLRILSGKIINHPYVQALIVTLIIANAFMMGLATFDFVTYNPEIQAKFEKVDLAFLILFTTESAMQLIFHGRNLFKDGWLTFDFLIVICSWCFSSLQVFRTMRTLRLIARIKILRRLCEALIEAVPRLGGILCLFVLIMYIYAVMVTVLFGDLYERGVTKVDYFSRLDLTAFTLFQMITLDWANIVREVMAVYPMAYFVFSTYLTFTSFILFSLIIGVVCDAVSAIEHDTHLVEMLEEKEDAQERILRLQQRVDYLQKQQKSVLASVQTVLDEIVMHGEAYGDPYTPQVGLVAIPNSNLRSSGRSVASSLRSSVRSSLRGSRKSSASSVRGSIRDSMKSVSSMPIREREYAA
ncbi:PotAssium voltage-gated channel [Seminavis robusta]|uniref:PotAssium voltage-gated channel n=1 Tax=Seminavis robusta TaxID=568900 RepID=A0A9N8H661_9STRA|nr:PotAssium voltage-gated channel [Seminavis robusta]|eukprot:Sro37_g023350.1 PotAssium voltage-gated channel (689) ;mRNA; r:112599-114665